MERLRRTWQFRELTVQRHTIAYSIETSRRAEAEAEAEAQSLTVIRKS